MSSIAKRVKGWISSRWLSMKEARKNYPVGFYFIAAAFLLVAYATYARFLDEISVGDWAVAMGTMLLGIATFVLVLEQRRVAQEQSRPDVMAGMEIPYGSPPEMYFVVKNIGKGTAVNISVQTSPELVNSSGRNISQKSLFTNVIDFILPGYEKGIHFDVTPAYLSKSDLPKSFSYVIRYEDSLGRVYVKTIRQDLSHYPDLSFSCPSDFRDTGRALRKIEANIDALTGEVRFLREAKTRAK